MATTPQIVENVSELAPTLKVRHVGRSDPWTMKARKGLKQQYMLRGRNRLVHSAKRGKRAK